MWSFLIRSLSSHYFNNLKIMFYLIKYAHRHMRNLPSILWLDSGFGPCEFPGRLLMNLISWQQSGRLPVYKKIMPNFLVKLTPKCLEAVSQCRTPPESWLTLLTGYVEFSIAMKLPCYLLLLALFAFDSLSVLKLNLGGTPF